MHYVVHTADTQFVNSLEFNAHLNVLSFVASKQTTPRHQYESMFQHNCVIKAHQIITFPLNHS